VRGREGPDDLCWTRDREVKTVVGLERTGKALEDGIRREVSADSVDGKGDGGVLP
jgi:hypothetical protein